MPGWHAKTRKLVKEGKLIVLGIAPEQHGDRMALFLQWKGMEDMPVLLDSYNLYGLKAVPITLLVDESGVVRYRNPGDQDLADFLALPPAEVGTAPTAPRDRELDLAGNVSLANPIEAGELAPAEFFRYGVAHRKVYDHAGAKADPEHFERAVYYWRRALKGDPTNYIWRRRLQQYGPRLDKPYPFYDWIETARRDLKSAGKKPRSLAAEPTGAEIAKPSKDVANILADLPHPDPDNKLPQDVNDVMSCKALVVPHTKEPLKAVRVFLTLTPNTGRKAKWNDEAGFSTVRLQPPAGWKASKPVVVLTPSHELARIQAIQLLPRRVEFELHRTGPVPPENAAGFKFQLYYNVCHGEEGVCQLLRRDLTVDYDLLLPEPGDDR